MEMIETKHDLLTTKYTKVLEEADYKYNAPHTFKVIKAEEETSEEHKGENLEDSIVESVLGYGGVRNADERGYFGCLTKEESFAKARELWESKKKDESSENEEEN